MSTVVICRDAVDPAAWTYHYNVADVGDCIKEQLVEWPANARIYLNNVSESCNVTPTDLASEAALREMSGVFYVIFWPEDPITILIIAIVVAVVAIVATLIFRPNSAKQQIQASPNNTLSGRQNSARPNERVPDIVGTVVAYPDLITNPWTEFVNSQQVEISAMCIGVGSYSIGPDDVRDDVTRISDVAGASVEIYGPNTSPNSGAAPQLTIGVPINRPLVLASASSSINGQTLRPPLIYNVSAPNIAFGQDFIQLELPYQQLDFSRYFGQYDTLVLTNAGVDGKDFSGNYQVLSATQSEIILANPGRVNPAWNQMTGGARTNRCTPTISNTGNSPVGYYSLLVDDMTEVWFNFVAPNGLYRDDGTNKYALSVDIEVSVQSIDANNMPIGAEQVQTVSLTGSASALNLRAITYKYQLPVAGRCRVKARRATGSSTDKGTVVDNIIWRDCYAISPMKVNDFGDVTTLQTMTYATEGATSAKSRKLNVLCTRNIQRRTVVPAFIDPLGVSRTHKYIPGSDNIGPTNHAGDIIAHLALDPTVGRRPTAEVDFDGIYAQLDAAADYFGTTLMNEFCYTFDDSNTSFEESLIDIAQACFCTAYRRASKLSIFFEQQTSNSKMLFNHRNKKPGTETRTYKFGFGNNNDGVELSYIDPNAPNSLAQDTPVVLYFPENRTATNPKKVTTVGVRNNVQAKTLGWRYYNKLKYQSISTKFDALAEAQLLLQTQRFIAADNTRSGSIDGEVRAQNALELTLSQPVPQLATATDMYIFLQHPDATVESIPILPGSDFGAGFDAGNGFRKVILQRAPLVPVHTDYDSEVNTLFAIGSPSNKTAMPFLLTERSRNQNIFTLTGINYDDRYYSRDSDYKNNVISYNGTVYNGVPYTPPGVPQPVPAPYTGVEAVVDLLVSRSGGTVFQTNGFSVVYGGSGYTSASTAVVSGQMPRYPYTVINIFARIQLDANGTITRIDGAQGTQWYGPPDLTITR